MEQTSSTVPTNKYVFEAATVQYDFTPDQFASILAEDISDRFGKVVGALTENECEILRVELKLGDDPTKYGTDRLGDEGFDVDLWSQAGTILYKVAALIQDRFKDGFKIAFAYGSMNGILPSAEDGKQSIGIRFQYEDRKYSTTLVVSAVKPD